MTLRVAIADDSALLRRGLAALLTSEGLEVACEAADATELLGCVAALQPDVAVVDIRMPPTFTTEGIQAATAIRHDHPGTGSSCCPSMWRPKTPCSSWGTERRAWATS